MEQRITFSERDEFHREKIAQNIITLIESDLPISPLVIDGDWGTGKTEFSLKLKTMLYEEMNEHVIYIDAFKEDHTDTPVLSIAAAIYSVLPEKEKPTFLEKSLPTLKFGLKTTLKAGTAWVLRQNADNLAEELNDVMKNIAEKSIEHSIESLIEEHASLEKNISTLQDSLGKLSINKKIIIIVDELDRCRPSYAVNFLESIKHIFQTENVFFILVANMNQIRASVSHAYGTTVDSKKYLDKFIKYTINLPNNFTDNTNSVRNASAIYWYNEIEKRRSFYERDHLKSPPIISLIYKANLSLRETESFIRHIEVYSIISNKPFELTHQFDLKNYSTILAIFLYCFCSRETLSTFPSRESIAEMSLRMGIKSLNNMRLDETNPPIFEIIFLLFIKDHGYVDHTFYNPLAIDERLNIFILEKSHSIETAKTQIKYNINSTFKILSLM